MKTFVAAVCIAVVIVAGSLLYTRELDDIAGEMEDLSKEVISRVQEEDFGGAAEKTHRLTDLVDKKKTLLSMAMDHTALDKIESNLAELSEYVDGSMQTDALAKGRVLEVLFEHLPKNYKLRIENIL